MEELQADGQVKEVMLESCVQSIVSCCKLSEKEETGCEPAQCKQVVM